MRLTEIGPGRFITILNPRPDDQFDVWAHIETTDRSVLAAYEAAGWSFFRFQDQDAGAPGGGNGNNIVDDGLVHDQMPPPTKRLTLIVYDESGEIGGAVETDDYEKIDRLLNSGYIPIRGDGEPYTVFPFMGGILLDGTPLNVILGQGWIETQKEVLIPLIEAGDIPEPENWAADATISLDALPDAVTFAGFGGAGWLPIVAGLGLLWVFFGKSKAPSVNYWWRK